MRGTSRRAEVTLVQAPAQESRRSSDGPGVGSRASDEGSGKEAKEWLQFAE